MKIIFHKISDQRHSLEILRIDGSREFVDCETRSFLSHDLAHYAVETEAKLSQGFWGRLAAGRTIAELSDPAQMGELYDDMSEILAIEQSVAIFQSLAKGKTSGELFEAFQAFAKASGRPTAPWITEEFVHKVEGRMRQLVGHWKATPFRGKMELHWKVTI